MGDSRQIPSSDGYLHCLRSGEECGDYLPQLFEHHRFFCPRCERDCCACFGAGDDMFVLCDDCVCELDDKGDHE